MPPSPRAPSVMRMPSRVEAGRVELDELHVLEREPVPQRDGEPVAGARMRVRRRLEGAPVAARREARGRRVERVDLAGQDLVGHDARDALTVGRLDEVEDLELVVEGDLVLDALLVERVQDHVARPVGRVASPPDRRLAEVARVPAEAALGDLALARAAEGHAVVLELDEGPRRVLAHLLDGVLVAEVVRALRGVEGVPEPVVLLLVAERGADAALGGAGVAAERVELRDDGHVGPALGGVEGRHEPGAARADDDDVVGKGHAW